MKQHTPLVLSAQTAAAYTEIVELLDMALAGDLR